MKDYEIMIIREYTGKISKAVVRRYTNIGNRLEYEVEWTLNDPELRKYAGDSTWYRDKADAIAHAQFLAGRY